MVIPSRTAICPRCHQKNLAISPFAGELIAVREALLKQWPREPDLAQQALEHAVRCTHQEARLWIQHAQSCPQPWLDEEALSIVKAVDAAFQNSPKPVHFTDPTHCPECADHDQTLRNHQRDTIPRNALGCAGYDPITFSNPAGVAYYMPALVRYALTPNLFDQREWYGEQWLFHIQRFADTGRHINTAQRRAVLAAVQYLQARPEWVEAQSGLPHTEDISLALQALSPSPST